MATPMTEETKKVHLISLGCPKNRVDSEVMLGHLAANDYQYVDSPEQAGVIVVNTCGFIDAAKAESIDVITEMAELKRANPTTKLIVTGCLSQRYAPELAREIPEVDHFLGTGNFEAIVSAVEAPPQTKSTRLNIIQNQQNVATKTHPRLVGKNALVPYRHGSVNDHGEDIYIPDPDFTIRASSPRVHTQALYSSYLKISEGCSNTCAFCIIPKLRGPQRSRPIADIVNEVATMIEKGTVEFNLIAQDLCAFGKDLSPKQSLAQLLTDLETLGGKSQKTLWFRCLYAYPRGLTAEVIDILAQGKFVIPYLDMPLQHIADSMLQRMRRGKGGDSTRELVLNLHKQIPNLSLRTTFITGMPGETDDDFQALCAFVKEVEFDHMGIFTYSPEADTPAAMMSDQVAKELAEERRDILMELQQAITTKKQQSLLGKTIDVLMNGVSDESDLLLQGRHMGQAPEIDGVTYISAGTANPGEFKKVKITQAHKYDVVGEIIDDMI